MTDNEPKKVTFRTGASKAHRGLVFPDGWLVAVCGCPGSQNGRLTKSAKIICDGWDKSNCQNKS